MLAVRGTPSAIFHKTDFDAGRDGERTQDHRDRRRGPRRSEPHSASDGAREPYTRIVAIDNAPPTQRRSRG